MVGSERVSVRVRMEARVALHWRPLGGVLYFYILEAMDGAKAFLAKLTPRYALRMTWSVL